MMTKKDPTCVCQFQYYFYFFYFAPFCVYFVCVMVCYFIITKTAVAAAWVVIQMYLRFVSVVILTAVHMSLSIALKH